MTVYHSSVERQVQTCSGLGMFEKDIPLYLSPYPHTLVLIAKLHPISSDSGVTIKQSKDWVFNTFKEILLPNFIPVFNYGKEYMPILKTDNESQAFSKELSLQTLPLVVIELKSENFKNFMIYVRAQKSYQNR